jgi:hypothetical protein
MRGGPVSGLSGTSYLGSEIRFGGIMILRTSMDLHNTLFQAVSYYGREISISVMFGRLIHLFPPVYP